MTEISHALTTSQKQREIEMKEMQETTEELMNMSNGERQKIIMQISAVQTECAAMIEKR